MRLMKEIWVLKKMYKIGKIKSKFIKINIE